MLHIKDYFQRLKLKVQPEHALNAVIFSIILVVIAVSFFSARYPVSSEQYFKIQKLLPHTAAICIQMNMVFHHILSSRHDKCSVSSRHFRHISHRHCSKSAYTASFSERLHGNLLLPSV